MVTETVNLRVWNQDFRKLAVVQGEIGTRELTIEIQDAARTAMELSGYAARLYITEAGGRKIFTDCTISGNKITASVPMMTTPGDAKAQIVLTKGDDVLKVTGIVFDVRPSDLEGAMDTSDDWSVLTAMIGEVNTATEAANNAAGAANTAAALAGEKAGAANTAATNANTAASGANQAKSQAEAAATRAEQKADEANTAATNANTAASTANQAAENAETAADTAQTVADTVQQKLDNGEFIGPPGPQGKKGNPGEDFRVLGYYDTLALLQAAVPSPTAGDVYGVGTSAPYTIYIFDAVGGTWVDNGTIQGPQGEAGADGAPGPNEVSTNTATNITGLLKGNGANVLAAEAGTDFATAGIADSGGSASTGYWVKYDDGTMICYKRATIMPNVQTAMGDFYRSDYISLGDFPAAFTTLTYIQPEIWYANYSTLYMWCTAVYGPSTTSAGSVAVISNSKFSSLVEVMYTAIGRWK